MPCYKPLKAWRKKTLNDSGKRGITFRLQDGYQDMPVEIPCGQCIGCRLERSRQWAIRCVHEASQYENNSFITLTYNNENLPEDWSLNKKHFQDFMKRLRKKNQHKKIRFFHCGEYGKNDKEDDPNEIGRPHYHACIFNHDFPDKELWSIRDGIPLYRSDELEKLWPKGFSTIGDVTFESAAYVSRYITKKITGDKAEEHYNHTNLETGETNKLEPEYTTMSRRPGIGRDWYDEFKDDVHPSDFLVIRGKKVRPPKYYDALLEIEDEEEYKKIKAKRIKEAKKNKQENTRERLDTKEKIKQVQFKMLPRNIEDD